MKFSRGKINKKMFGRKSQIVGQIFIYILAIIVVSLILVYGYNAIKNFAKRGEQVAYITLKTDLENAFKSVKTDFGSIKRPNLDIPGKYKKVCFVEPGKYSETHPICKQGDAENEPLVCSGWQTGRSNIYLCPDCTDSFNVGEIEIINGVNNNNYPYLCIPVVNNKINLQIEGRGDHVRLSTFPTN